ncbi:MAG: hypothetical protein K2P80_12215 [Beijerinckiaceae bacterium]|nr:hypothetical protein [Beijerinckiaceae bacterium]
MLIALHICVGVLLGARFTISIMLPAAGVIVVETLILVLVRGVASGLSEGVILFFVLQLSFLLAAFLRWATKEDTTSSPADLDEAAALKAKQDVPRRRDTAQLLL